RMDCSVCSLYPQCGVWHDITNVNNGEERTTRNFCAIAAGSQNFAPSGTGATTATSPRGCGWNASAHPICESGRASIHVTGFGIPTVNGLLLNESYCSSVGKGNLLTIECTDW
ncbi:MAG: hypothetical protein AAGC55_28840, partial [Myxococcota bacterium]